MSLLRTYVQSMRGELVYFAHDLGGTQIPTCFEITCQGSKCCSYDYPSACFRPRSRRGGNQTPELGCRCQSRDQRLCRYVPQSFPRISSTTNNIDDPTLQPIFHPLHGLITLHSFPHTHLLPPTIKHSSLLGLSSGGGGSENNLGFRARRKRWGVETVHLGIDGGVGERRTEPAPEVARMVSAAPVPSQPSVTSEGVERVSIVEPKVEEVGEVKVKKEKRARVRFGEDQVLEAPTVSVDTPASYHGHEHGHDHNHDGHGHGHGQGQSGRPHNHDQAPRATVRHDRPDLYEF
jgi:hypothetical protein